MSDVPVTSTAFLSPRRWRWPIWLAEATSRRAEHDAVRRSRERLAEYDDHLLADIGLSREQATGRAAVPTWATPDWWRTRTL
ncbi:DUF1127 domain-containing protein [Rubellimicrobium aerolatum]|uniref:DUF1127 domain-containing protein n=1 Tax=Rubellimicrobium aerolatum TaxID=490979 RepID=A0ABW0SDM6_9RHOB